MRIKITRGDTMYITVGLGEYELETGDTLTFTVKKSTNTEDVIIQKIVTSGEIKLDPEDTKQLPYGDYVYDVQLDTKDGEVYTVVKPSAFVITEEVTW